MSTDWRSWIEAGKQIAQDPTRPVRCPTCGEADLVVLDVPLPDGVGVERHMTCPSCRSTNSLLIRHPDRA
jgi:DNA-directed RNA polymerase subunit RPC12/RpoP